MPKVTPDTLAVLHRQQAQLRNVCVIAHVDHGKSTLSDSLVSGAGLLAQKDVGKVRKTDGRADEQARCITIKSTGISLFLGAEAVRGLESPKALQRLLARSEQDDSSDTGAAAAAAAEGFLVNLIDCPGHVDFSSEVTAALRLCDGALVVVDCIEGCAVQTRTVLRQALTERVRPALVINKLDRALGETQDSPEELFQRCFRAVEDVNMMIAKHQDARLMLLGAHVDTASEANLSTVFDADWRVSPARGQVAFTVALHGWGFTLPQFAEVLLAKGKLDGVAGAESIESLADKLWGEWYLDTKARCFVQQHISPTTGRKLKRGFVQFVAEPIMAMLRGCGLGVGRSDFGSSAQAAAAETVRSWDSIQKLLEAVSVPESRWPRGREVRAQLVEGPPKELMRTVMQAWLPAHEALLSMVAVHLPSPPAAMIYRCEQFYTGPRDDPAAIAIRKCDPNGPLCVFISKHVPTKDNSRFISFGRVFSGTLRSNDKVCILGPDYDGPPHDGSMDTSRYKPKDVIDNVAIQRTVVMMADRTEPADAVPAGNTVAIFGIDAHVNKTCTLVDAGALKGQAGRVWPLAQLRYTVAPVVRVAVAAKNPADIGKLSAALRKLSVSDPLVHIASVKSTGEHTVACAGELHLEICLSDLTGMFLPKGVDITVSEPAVPHQETVDALGQVCLAKSTNKHNRFWVTAEPLPEDLVVLLDSGSQGGEALRAGIGPDGALVASADSAMKARAHRLHSEFGLDLNEARKIWAFGPEAEGGAAELARGGTGAMTCMLVDCSRGVQYLHEARDTLIGGFHEVTRAGVLAGEPLRGVLFKLHDALLHPDAPHRSPGQIVPAFKRAMHAAQLSASPKLVEPVFMVDVTCADDGGACVGQVYNMLGTKRGAVVVEEVAAVAGALPVVRAHLPVAESFGFASELRQATGGEAFPQLAFDHWSVLHDLVFTPTADGRAASAAGVDMIRAIRERKKFSELTPPALDKLVDRL